VHIPDVNTSDDKTTATEQGEEINQTNATTHEEETKKEILKRVKKLPFMRLVSFPTVFQCAGNQCPPWI